MECQREGAGRLVVQEARLAGMTTIGDCKGQRAGVPTAGTRRRLLVVVGCD